MAIQSLYPTGSAASPHAGAATVALTADTGFDISFKDLLDVINPLQQLPVIGSLYREITGDTISAGARMAGGYLMGGPVGFALAAANAGLEAVSGDDAAGHVFSFFEGESDRQYAMASYRRTTALIPA